MTRPNSHRLNGLEPDNLLAFLALLGLLRSIEEARPTWRPRVAWTVDAPPVRPVLRVTEREDEETITAAVAEGLRALASRHEFGQLKDLRLSPEEATKRLQAAVLGEGYVTDLWASLVSDGATRDKNKAAEAEPTPLCLLFGQGHMHFMSRLASVAQESVPPARGIGRTKIQVSETDCLREALFTPWARPDATFSFRWDPHEDVRYALRATDPTNPKTKETTQHGANRLAAIGLSSLTVVPELRGGAGRLSVLGGKWERGGFAFTWPIWRDSISLASVRALLGHPGLDSPATRNTLGVAERRRARRISSGRFMNFTRAEVASEEATREGSSRQQRVGERLRRARGDAGGVLGTDDAMRQTREEG